MFRDAFPDDPDPVSAVNYGRALQAYQATLITPAAFDDYLGGSPEALDTQQKDGLSLFLSLGCAGCHSGALLGGGSMQRFGIVRDYGSATGSQTIDEGLFTLTGEEKDRWVFRMPMLRNVARTAPYFHDGSVETLAAAVRIMADVQLGRVLEGREVDTLVAFLEGLTGTVPEHYAAPGAFPAPP